ncbi:P-loop NTPase [uncultured Clostridium sp.]|uniref:P-loop NTPase n=1 Tax=uncultured Clostridium sp. TaxID=59620 RepID=UPI00262B68A4|nr:P-loop NTPase [uncultured Clostridium sp.]
MGSCSSCPSKGKCSVVDTGKSCPSDLMAKMMPKYGTVKNIIGVVSGKGGVGKSTVTGILATTLKEQGYKVGVLDADITGPSMPRIFGIHGERSVMTAVNDGKGVKFEPVLSKTGIKVNSLNLVNEVEDAPVIWRGPVVTGVLNQLYADTNWGELDYLLIDMPPGTGDVTLTVMQSYPITELIVVSTPQDMVSMIVKKLVTMASKIGVPVRGVVENMAYIECECGKKMKIFSKKSSEEHAEILGLPLIAELPINLELTEALEEGKAEAYIVDNPLYSSVFSALY